MAKDSEGEYARVLRRLIDDPAYCRLPAPARLVWLTLIIAPEFRVIGIATLDVPVLQRRTGLSTKVCNDALELLEDASIIRRDAHWCWIRNHLRFQENSEVWARSPQTMAGLSKRLNEVPAGLSFLAEFFELYSGLGFKFELAPRLKRHITKGHPTMGGIPPLHPDNPEPETPETPETPEPETPEPKQTYAAAVRGVMQFYRRVTARKVTPEAHADAIIPRLRNGATVTTLNLAILGAALQSHYIGLNDRGTVYMDPETILKAKRFDGHANFAREATFQIPNADEVWEFWSKKHKKPRLAVMEHMFRARDEMLIEEGGDPIGPAAIYPQRYRVGDPWPETEAVAS